MRAMQTRRIKADPKNGLTSGRTRGLISELMRTMRFGYPAGRCAAHTRAARLRAAAHSDHDLLTRGLNPRPGPAFAPTPCRYFPHSNERGDRAFFTFSHDDAGITNPGA